MPEIPSDNEEEKIREDRPLESSKKPGGSPPGDDGDDDDGDDDDEEPGPSGERQIVRRQRKVEKEAEAQIDIGPDWIQWDLGRAIKGLRSGTPGM